MTEQRPNQDPSSTHRAGSGSGRAGIGLVWVGLVALFGLPAAANEPQQADGLLRSPLERREQRPWSWAAWSGQPMEPAFGASSVQDPEDEPIEEVVEEVVEEPVEEVVEEPDNPGETDGGGEPADPGGSGEPEPDEPAPEVPADSADPSPVAGTPDTVEQAAPSDEQAPADEPQPEAAPVAEAPLGDEPLVDEPVVDEVVSPYADLDLGLYARAVAPIPLGIPVARSRARADERAAAWTKLAAALEGPHREPWLTFLAEELRYTQTNPATWRGLAELVVELELFELAPDLATGLEGEPRLLTFQVARSCLSDLYGRWFVDRADFEAYVDGLQPDPATLRVLAELREARRSGRERLIDLFALDQSVAVAHLGDADAVVRMAAAGVLARDLAEGHGEVEALIPPLLDQLAVERWPDVAEVLLDAVGDALDARPAGDPMVERLRGGLADAASGGAVGAEVLIASALARLPWTGVEAAAPDSLERGGDLVALLVERVLRAPEAEVGAASTPTAASDPDVTLAVLRSIETLLRSGSGDLATAARLAGGDLRAPLRALLADASAATSVRVVVAGILPEVAPPGDLQQLTDLLAADEEAISTELRFALLRAVGRFARRGDAGPEVLGPAVDRLALEFQRPEADVRRLALELLAEEALAPYLAGRDLTPFVAGLDAEQSPELRNARIALLERHGSAATLERVLALEGLADLIASDPAVEAAMARLIGKLAAGDPLLALDGAQALWDVQADEGQVTRRTRALALVAELPVEVVGPLSGAAHFRISFWANTLRAQGVELASAMPGGVGFLERLVDVHVPRSGQDSAYSPADQALMTALFLSDIAAARGNGEAARMQGRVLENFALAEEKAAEHTNPDFRLLVLRSRARFLAGSGSTQALDDFAALFGSGKAGMLETVDLRSASELAARAAEPVPSEADATLAWTYSKALVTHPSWGEEPPAVRLEDLRHLAERASATGDAGIVEAARGLFRDLPEAPRPVTANAEPRIWHGLQGDAASLDQLLALREQLRAEGEALVAALPPAESSPSGPQEVLDGDEGAGGPDEQPEETPPAPVETPEPAPVDPAGSTGAAG